MNKLAEETKVEKEVTEEVEENKEAEAEVVEEEKVDQEDQIIQEKYGKSKQFRWINGKMIIIKCLRIWKTLKDVCKMNMQIT